MPGTIWERFEHDPRRPENAALRAADRDRDAVHELLGTAFADGRLDRDEFDERAEQVSHAKTLGELPPLVSDLVVTSSAPRLPMTTADRRATAELKYRRMRSQALSAFLVPTLICWVIWSSVLFAGNGTPFPWPIFVTIGTGWRWFQLVTTHEDTVASIERSMVKREQRAQRHLEKRQRRELGGPPYPPPPVNPG